MRARCPSFATFGSVLAVLILAVSGRTDDHVIVSAQANPDYTAQKYAGPKPKAETYVVMQGNYFAGATVDTSIERMPFRKIAGYLAAELAKREYWPARDPNQADLLLVIHWGTTMPTVSTLELLARTNPNPDVSASRDGLAHGVQREGDTGDGATTVGAGGDLLSGLGTAANLNATYADDLLRQQADENDAEASQSNTAQLLGYVATMRKFRNSMLPTVTEATLRRTLEQERYFVIVQAYDLSKWQKGTPNKSIWSIRLNISSPGNNFDMAMSRMSKAGIDYFGRTTSEIATVRSKTYEGNVKFAPLVILGEVK